MEKLSPTGIVILYVIFPRKAFGQAPQLNTPPAKAGGFTVATKVAFRLKPVWPLLKQAEVIPPQFGRFHLHLPVA